MEKTVTAPQATPAKKTTAILAACVGALIISMAVPYLIIPVSESIKPKVLIKMPGIKPERGDYITFELHNAKLPNGKAFLTKRLSCLPGDYLDGRAGAFFCNNHLVATALEKDGYNRPMTWFKFQGVIPKNRVFVVGDDPRSYDSRYWGFIPLDTVIYSWPIF